NRGDEQGTVGRAPLQWVTEWLGLDPASHFGEYALRHLVATQLAPRGAIDYDPSNPTPRWRLVEEYLSERYALERDETARLARGVATVLDHAALERGVRLMEADRALSCAICRLPFSEEPESVRTLDPYKPTWQAPEELTKPEIDHVIPISGLGAHAIE